MEWKLIAAGVWECSGTKVTIRFVPESLLPYGVFWNGSELPYGACTGKDEAFRRAQEFIFELTEAGMDA